MQLVKRMWQQVRNVRQQSISNLGFLGISQIAPCSWPVTRGTSTSEFYLLSALLNSRNNIDVKLLNLLPNLIDQSCQERGIKSSRYRRRSQTQAWIYIVNKIQTPLFPSFALPRFLLSASLREVLPGLLFVLWDTDAPTSAVVELICFLLPSYFEFCFLAVDCSLLISTCFYQLLELLCISFYYLCLSKFYKFRNWVKI